MTVNWDDGEHRRVRIEDYFHSLSREFDALKDRVRYLIQDRHWQTDGEWKESVLRSVLQRSIPRNMTIGRGFIVDSQRSSSQIDVLIYDSSYPILYKDGDLVFISPSSCRAIIEVKTRVTRLEFSEALRTLGDNAELARGHGHPRQSVFTGLFAYEDTSRLNMLEGLQEAAEGRYRRIVDHVSIGPSKFVKFWMRDPATGRPPYQYWHEYRLPQIAQGYFAHNLATELAPNEQARRELVWFPEEGKEPHLQDKQEFSGRFPPTAFSERARRAR